MRHRIRGRAQPAVAPLCLTPEAPHHRHRSQWAGARAGPLAAAPHTQGGVSRALEARSQGPRRPCALRGSSCQKTLALRTQCPSAWGARMRGAPGTRPAVTFAQPPPTSHPHSYTGHTPRKPTHTLLYHSHTHSCTHLHSQQLTWVHAHNTSPQTDTGLHSHNKRRHTVLTLSYTVTHTTPSLGAGIFHSAPCSILNWTSSQLTCPLPD